MTHYIEACKAFVVTQNYVFPPPTIYIYVNKSTRIYNFIMNAAEKWSNACHCFAHLTLWKLITL